MFRSENAIAKSIVAVVVVIIVVVSAAGIALYAGSAGQMSSTPTSVRTTTTLAPTPTATTTASIPSSTVQSSTNATLQKVIMVVQFPPTEYATWFYYGIDHGIYAKYGLAPTYQTAPVYSAVASGKAEFGFADPGALAVAYVTGNVTNVREVAMVYQRTPYAVIYNKAVIKTISDLNGKKGGDFKGSSTGAELPIFAKANNINLSTISFTYTTPALINSLVALGTVDFILQTINAQGDTAPFAAQHGIQLGAFPYADYGLDLYGNGIITSTDMIAKNPGLVQRFVRASLESAIAAARDPQAGVTSLVKSNPQLNATIALAGWKLLVATSIPDANQTAYSSNPLALGRIDATKMKYTTSVIAQSFQLKNPPDPSQLYVSNFVQSP